MAESSAMMQQRDSLNVLELPNEILIRIVQIFLKLPRSTGIHGAISVLDHHGGNGSGKYRAERFRFGTTDDRHKRRLALVNGRFRDLYQAAHWQLSRFQTCWKLICMPDIIDYVGTANAARIRYLCCEFPVHHLDFPAPPALVTQYMPGLKHLVLYHILPGVLPWELQVIDDEYPPDLVNKHKELMAAFLFWVVGVTKSHPFLKKAVCAAEPGYPVIPELGSPMLFIKLMAEDMKHDESSEFILNCKDMRDFSLGELKGKHPCYFALPDEVGTSEPGDQFYDGASSEFERFLVRSGAADKAMMSKTKVAELIADWIPPPSYVVKEEEEEES